MPWRGLRRNHPADILILDFQSPYSKKISSVVVGENAGSKERKARELGIPILSEDDFLAMLQ